MPHRWEFAESDSRERKFSVNSLDILHVFPHIFFLLELAPVSYWQKIGPWEWVNSQPPTSRVKVGMTWFHCRKNSLDHASTRALFCFAVHATDALYMPLNVMRNGDESKYWTYKSSILNPVHQLISCVGGDSHKASPVNTILQHRSQRLIGFLAICFWICQLLLLNLYTVREGFQDDMISLDADMKAILAIILFVRRICCYRQSSRNGDAFQVCTDLQELFCITSLESKAVETVESMEILTSTDIYSTDWTDEQCCQQQLTPHLVNEWPTALDAQPTVKNWAPL